MPAVRKNKQKNKWEFDYKDLTGKRKTKGGFATKVEAEKAQAKMIDELNKGLFVANDKLTFREAAELYLDNYAKIYCKKSTWVGYEGYLKHHIYEYLGDLKLLEIRPLHIQNFIKDMTKTGLANSTINHFKKTIGAVFNYMIDSGVIYQNPVNRIKCLKVKNNTLMRPLTIKETNKLLTVTKKHYPDFYPVLYIAVNTGLREGELFALTWDCVNFIEGYIVENKSYTHGVLGSTKTGKERKVKISLTVTKFLKEWKMACPKSELNLVFPNANGNYMDSQNMMKRRFKPALALAGIDSIRFHDLRHTYASTLIIQQVPLPYISKQLGHSTNKVTLDTYVHLMPESAQLGDSLLENLYEDRDTGLEESNVRRFGT